MTKKPYYILIGLGNPGTQYQRTRHNVGFMAIDALAHTFGEGEWKTSKKLHACTLEGSIEESSVLFVKPQTFMNLSGASLEQLVSYYKIAPAKQIIVFCDDVDLPLGAIRFRMRGGPGTHNGLKSIVAVLGEDFPRMRIGIGPKPLQQDLASWVLSAFSADEQKTITGTLTEIESIVPSQMTTLAEIPSKKHPTTEGAS